MFRVAAFCNCNFDMRRIIKLMERFIGLRRRHRNASSGEANYVSH